MPVNFTENIAPSTSSTPQSLAEDFLLLMTSFRGGNHPYLEKYRAHLRSLQIMEAKPQEWPQR
jgi:hypothetical protein